MNQHSPAEAKIALFRSLFHGREDVYPRRFESRKTGRAGYSPVCGNEWVQGICEKPRIKCSECPHQRFLPVTDDVIRWHLQGHDDHSRDFVIGVYPMLLDETCFFLAADFDKTTWQDDVGAFFGNLPSNEFAGGLGAIALGQGRTHLVLLQRSRACHFGAKVWGVYSDGNHGTSSRHWPGFVRPFLSQSRHSSTRRLRQLNRLATAEAAARIRQWRFPG